MLGCGFCELGFWSLTALNSTNKSSFKKKKYLFFKPSFDISYIREHWEKRKKKKPARTWMECERKLGISLAAQAEWGGPSSFTKFQKELWRDLHLEVLLPLLIGSGRASEPELPRYIWKHQQIVHTSSNPHILPIHTRLSTHWYSISHYQLWSSAYVHSVRSALVLTEPSYSN